MSTISCDHNYVGEISKTRIRGNNFDIEAVWETRRCKHCPDVEKRLVTSKQIPHEGYEHTDQLTSPARFGT